MRSTHTKSSLVALITLLAATPLVLGAHAASGSETLDLSLCAPDQNEFTLTIDNAFFPLSQGQQWILVGKDNGAAIGLQVTVLGATESFYKGQDKVLTRVVEEQEWEDANENGSIDDGEDLIEVSLNYFAQTQDGTVCYLGEDVEFYEDGGVVSTDGSWRADDEGNAPGIYVPAEPEPGMTFAREVAPGIAEEVATILPSGKVKVPAGTYDDTLKVQEYNPLDGGRGTKYYANGVGIIVDGSLRLLSTSS